MSRSRRAVLVAIAASAVLLNGCRQPDQLDMGQADVHIASTLTATYHLPVTQLSCPAKEDVRVGSTFPCTLRVDGHPLTVTVTQRTTKGDLGVKPDAAVLVMATVRANMAHTFGAELHKNILSTDCGHLKVEVVAPGGSLACTVSDGAQTKHVTVKVLDVNGSLSYTIR